jgi:hypothetical protein
MTGLNPSRSLVGLKVRCRTIHGPLWSDSLETASVFVPFGTVFSNYKCQVYEMI